MQFEPSVPSGAAEVRAGGFWPTYEIASPSAWDFLGGRCASGKCGARVLVFGTLAQRYPVSRVAVRQLIEIGGKLDALRLADLKLRAPFYDTDTIIWTLRNADVLKLKKDELHIASELLGARGETMDLFRGLIREFAIEQAALTCGEAGAWIFGHGDSVHCPSLLSARPVDTVGAGNAFTAMLASGPACGCGLRDSAGRASKLASWVTCFRGATPAWNDDLRRSLDD